MPLGQCPTTSVAETPRRSTRIPTQPKEEKTVGTTKKRVASDEKEISQTKKAKVVEKNGINVADNWSKLASIAIGDTLPTLTLKNEKEEDIEIANLASEKGVIIFLVPKVNTPGCTNQACGFKNNYPDFSSLNYDVYCLSADSPTAQGKWQTKINLPYSLISDPKRVLIAALGADDNGKTKRSHYIFEKGGKLVDKKIKVKPFDSAKLTLEFIQSL